MGRKLKLAISIILLIFVMQVPQVLAQGEDEVLAKIGNEVITRADFETRLKSYPPAAQEMFKHNLEKGKNY